jgi:2-polyprenyl-6-methoxyphenol hydroxylase-like FAD-dependent oxidoreductase
MVDSKVPPTGIKVIIVGTGFAGLTAAIECHRNGHSVLVLESFPELKQLGDIISFGQNSARIFRRWPGVAEQLEPISHRADNLVLKHYQGDTLAVQTWDEETKKWGKRYDGHRGEFHKIVFDHAKSLGIDIRLDHKVTEYFENDEQAGVLANGERFVADVVLAADGVRSTGRTLVLGYEDKPQPSGYAIYRAWFPSDEIAKDPLTSFFVGGPSDKHVCWLGPDVHFIAASLKKGSFSWVCTHKVRPGISSTCTETSTDGLTGRGRHRGELAVGSARRRRPPRARRLGPGRAAHHRPDARAAGGLEARLPRPAADVDLAAAAHRADRRRGAPLPADEHPGRVAGDGGRRDAGHLPAAGRGARARPRGGGGVRGAAVRAGAGGAEDGRGDAGYVAQGGLRQGEAGPGEHEAQARGVAA